MYNDHRVTKAVIVSEFMYGYWPHASSSLPGCLPSGRICLCSRPSRAAMLRTGWLLSFFGPVNQVSQFFFLCMSKLVRACKEPLKNSPSTPCNHNGPISVMYNDGRVTKAVIVSEFMYGYWPHASSSLPGCLPSGRICLCSRPSRAVMLRTGWLLSFFGHEHQVTSVFSLSVSLSQCKHVRNHQQINHYVPETNIMYLTHCC